jgi:hypothetical protein
MTTVAHSRSSRRSLLINDEQTGKKKNKKEEKKNKQKGQTNQQHRHLAGDWNWYATPDSSKRKINENPPVEVGHAARNVHYKREPLRKTLDKTRLLLLASLLVHVLLTNAQINQTRV